MNLTYQIIGGGIGGLSTALALQKEGLDYMLWEKDPQISYRQVGLGISNNILPLLNSWGILAETKALGAEIRRFKFVTKKLKTLRSLFIKAPALSIDRLKFTELLLQAIPPERIRLNTPKSFTDFGRDQVVIAAEGIHSPSRRAIYPQLKPRSSHQLLWRGMAILYLPSSYQHTYHDFIGGNLRFAIIHSGENVYSWYAIEESHDAAVAPPDAKQHLLDLFRNYHPLVPECIAATGNIYSEILQDLDPKQRKGLSWHQDKLVFVGDAIHATTPNMANGACLAMEDAYVLAKLLKKFPDDLNTAFSTYQSFRESKVNAIVRQSWLLGKMMHQHNPIIDKAILLGTRLTPQWAFDQIYSQVLNNESLRKVQALTADETTAW